MKRLLVLGILFACASFATAQKGGVGSDVPQLHKIMHVTLGPSYSCRSREDFKKGYEQTALFLSAAAKRINQPELLFDGACNSPDYFHAQTAGDDFDVITDYGDITLESLNASQAFSPLRRTDSLSTFVNQAPVKLGHTYGVLINKSSSRGLLYFRVTAYVPNKSVELDYVVMDYQLLRVEAQSAGFSWDKKGAR